MRIIHSLALAAMAIIAVSCGGTGAGGEQVLFKREKFEFNEEQPVLEYGIEHAQPAPETTVALDGVPGLDELPELKRELSNAPEDFVRSGSQLADPLLVSFATVQGNSLVMTPDWVRDADPPTSDLSWAVYGFNLSGYSTPGILQLWWDGAVPAAGDHFIGLSDFSTGRWQWFNGPAVDTAMDFGPLADYFSTNDDLYIAVLLTGQGSFQLDQLRIGPNQVPTAGLQASPQSGEVPLTVQLDASASTDLDGSIVSYEWDILGDGSFGDPQVDAATSHEYTQTGNYLVRVRVTDNEGGSAIAEQVVSVNPVANNDPPTAVLGADKTSGVAPLEVNFNGTASSDTDGTIVKYEWDLDANGSFETDTGATDNASTTFTAAGSYEVQLRVTDDQGSTDTDSLTIEVSEDNGENPPVAMLEVDYWFKVEAGVFSFDASGSTDPDNDIVRYEFDWDNDSNYDLDNGGNPLATHSFSEGSHEVTLRVTDAGDRSDTVTISITQGNGSAYAETEVNDTPAEADPLGGYASYARQVSGWLGNLGVGGYDGSEEDWLTFTASGPVDVQLDVLFSDALADVDIRLFHESDLEDSVASSTSTSDNEQISYSIPAAGTYFLRIYIWESSTARGPLDYTFNAITNKVPVVSFSVNPLSGNVPFPITLDATGSYDPDGSIAKYEWDVDGNGSFEVDTGLTSSLSTNMEASGLVDVAVRVTDDQGGEGFATVQVNAINAAPIVDLQASPLSGSAPLLVSFDASGSTDPDGHALVDFEWDFDGDGTWDDSGPSPTINHTYFSQGSFNATVRVTDEYGASATGSVTIDVSLTYDEVEDNDDYSTGNLWPSANFTGWFGNLGPGGPLDGDESDWFKLVIPAPGEYTINMYFTDALSDLDMKLYDTDGTSELDSSTSVSDNESITYDFANSGTYYVNSYVFSGSSPKEPQDYMMEVFPVV